MNLFPIINQKILKQNSYMKQNIRRYKRMNKKGHRRVLKNYIGKFVWFDDTESINAFDSEVEIKKLSENNKITQEDLLKMLDESNLTGHSGNGFRVADKMRTFFESKSNTRILIVNAVECEPGLLHDEWLLKNKWSNIYNSIQNLKSTIHFDEIILAHKLAILPLSEDMLQGVKIMRVPYRYPMGEEHFLIQDVLGIKAQPEMIPAHEGILVMNIQTIYQINQLLEGRYESGRWVTLAHLDTAQAQIAFVRYGQSIQSTLNNVWGCSDYIYSGQGLLNAKLSDADEIFLPQTCFAAISSTAMHFDERPCKKCGRCSRICPMGIKVKDIVVATEKQQLIEPNAFMQDLCMECGTCTFFCRSGIQVQKIIRAARSQ